MDQLCALANFHGIRRATGLRMRLWIGLVLSAGIGISASLISAVEVHGAPCPIPLTTRAEAPYDASTVEHDVRALHATGRFSDVRVESEETPGGPRMIFHLTPMPRLMLRKVEIVPDSFPLKPRNLAGEAVSPARARRIAEEYRHMLMASGYAQARVSPELVVVAPSMADVRLKVSAGRRVSVAKVRIGGDIDHMGERALQSLKGRWFRSAAYSEALVQADVARIQSAYVSRGFVDAVVQLDHTAMTGDKADVTLTVRPGKQFAAQEDMCKCLHKERQRAEAAGVVDFAARASVDATGVFSATTSEGRHYVLGRIEFDGNRRFSDASIRRNLLLNESEVFDVRLLRKSLDRLNRSSMFEPLNESNVEVRTDEKTGVADLRIHLRERKAGSWLLSGPIGPVSLAGPARFTLASRLPSWGGQLLDLSSYYASLHLGPGQFVLALQRPFVPAQGWASGFAIAPQLGWKNMAAQYAGNQFRGRLLAGPSLPAPPIVVTVERAGGDTWMVCDPPQPRWPWLKRGMSMALQFGSMLAL